VVGYLLDTNHVGALSRQDPKVMQKVNSLPADTQLRACTITLGEIEAGNRITQTTNSQQRNEVTVFVNAKFDGSLLRGGHRTHLAATSTD